jgi:restriction endonuclease S subunit
VAAGAGVTPEDWRQGTLSEIANITMGQSPDGKSYNEDGIGTVFGSINKNDMANLPVLIPTDEAIRQFEELVHPMDVTIEANYMESCHLQATRDTLLPRLMSGELSVLQRD